jgi:hypothetical protein
MGNLEGMASYGIVPASPGYGLYSDNVYLEGLIKATSGEIGGFTIDSTEGLYAGSGATRVQMKAGAGFWTGATAIGDAPFSVTNAGVLTAESGTVGGWTLDTDAIYSSSKHTGDGFADGGMTLSADGSFHTPNFYIDADYEIGMRVNQLVYGYVIGNSDLLTHTGGTVSENSTTYQLAKSIQLGSYLQSGRTLRISFSLKTSDAAYEAFGRIYRWRSASTTAVGTEQFTSSDTFVTFTEDIDDWEADDRIYLYLRHSVGGVETADNGFFKVLGSVISVINETDGASYS